MPKSAVTIQEFVKQTPKAVKGLSAFMKNLGIKLSILTAVFLLTSCASTWSRLPEAKTVALKSFDTEKDIVKYQIEKKKTVRMQNQDDIQIGLSEFAALGKGLKGGLKSGLSSVKEVAGGRVGAEVENANLLSKYFMSDMVNRITGSILFIFIWEFFRFNI